MCILLLALGCSSAWQPLKIKSYFSDPHMRALTPAQRGFLTDTLLPSAIAVWSDVLLVANDTPATTHVQPSCAMQFVDKHNCPVECKSLAQNGQCGGVAIPAAHLAAARTCEHATVNESSGANMFYGCSTTPQGEGVVGAHFVIYVTTTQEGMCADQETPGALAWTATCAIEDGTDRPIVGFINFCPSMLADQVNLNATSPNRSARWQ